MSRKPNKPAAPPVPTRLAEQWEALPVTTAPLLVAIAVDWLLLASASAATAERLEAEDGQEERARLQHRTTSHCADSALDALLCKPADHERHMADLLRMRRQAVVEMWG